MNGYPDGHCAKGSSIRVRITDAHQIFRQAMWTRDHWAKIELQAQQDLERHQDRCSVCATPEPLVGAI